ncbi:hypothetical protein IFM89_024847 [Coptis chinensis]|uniref:BHLH domain-containing protein n=1 Tax=Coptis chinensis TaxID=261450 RepID=A0A835LP04_9MAGN|nr:hypothetical protein IFM89_024847 [Coptis chinensis]
MSDCLIELFDHVEFGDANFTGGVLPDELFSILDALDSPPFEDTVFSPRGGEDKTRLVSQKSTSSSALLDSEAEIEPAPACKRRKLLFQPTPTSEEVGQDGQQRMLHITVERNRRKQMNEHLAGDQASIIGGVVDYIKELQQILQSLEAKKQRKLYSDVLISPRVVSSPRPVASSLSSPRKPPLSPRVSLPISPRTPTPSSPYKPRLQHGYLSPTTMAATSHDHSSTSSSSSTFDNVKELSSNSKSSVANVEVKISGANVLLKTVSSPITGQALKIIAALEGHSLEILHVNINTTDDTMINSFTIKVTAHFSTSKFFAIVLMYYFSSSSPRRLPKHFIHQLKNLSI